MQKLVDLDPLMIMRPMVRVAHGDLNQAYLLTQLVWASKDRPLVTDRQCAGCGCRIFWHQFDAENFAIEIGMTLEWLKKTAEDMRLVCFNYRVVGYTRPIVEINLSLLDQAISKLTGEIK